MTAKAPAVHILHCTPLEADGTVRALLRVRVGDVIFNRCLLICPDATALPTVSPPMIRWQEPDGAKRYAAVCEWSKPLRAAVNEAARRAFPQFAQNTREGKQA